MKNLWRRLFKIFAVPLCYAWVAACALASSVSDIDESLAPTRKMRAETIYMVRCMEELHLEHKDISLLDNKAILLDFLHELDQSRMIFLQKDVDELVKKFVPTLDIFVSGGSLVPAFSIFEKFRLLTYDRINWIFDRLDKDFDLSGDETFCPNRNELSWPLTKHEADDLWEKRLKFEVLGEAFSICKSEEKNRRSVSSAESVPVHESCAACSKEEILSKISDAIGNIKRRYESWKKTYRTFDSWLVQEMFLSSISRMYDPHTTFLSKDSFEDFSIHIKNSLIGIGAELRDENGVCTVHKLTPGGPAYLSGEIKVGDKIVAVAQGDDGEFADIVGMRLYKTVKLLRGKKDTVVRVKIETVSGDSKIVRLVRDNIKINATRASAKYFELQRDGKLVKVGVIVLPSFYGDVGLDESSGVCADKDIETLILKLKEIGIDALVMDLRQNGGGLLHQAVSIAGLFIKVGPVVQVKDSFGRVEKYFDKNEYIAWDGPLAVLTSPMSASAAEILVGALRDNKRAVIVGAEATYGKGSVQVALDMNTFFKPLTGPQDFGAAYVTVQKWYLPTGASTQLKGVSSDIILPSLDECFRKREADYPHALSWDTVPPVEPEQNDESGPLGCLISDSLIGELKNLSLVRQNSLEEFEVSRERKCRFDGIVNKNDFSLNIDRRLAEKKEDDILKKAIETKVKDLEILYDYTCEDIYLPDVALDDDISGAKKANEDVDGIAIFDTNLRECVRVAADLAKLIKQSEQISVPDLQ